MPRAKQFPEFKERSPSLAETEEHLRSWFKLAIERCGSLDLVEIEHTAIADFLVFKGLFTEKEAALKFILKTLQIKLDDIYQSVKICYNQF